MLAKPHETWHSGTVKFLAANMTRKWLTAACSQLSRVGWVVVDAFIFQNQCLSTFPVGHEVHANLAFALDGIAAAVLLRAP